MPIKKKIAKSVDTHSYKGWLNSDSFVKRAFASLGYQIVATLMIYGVILGFALVIGLIAFLVGGAMHGWN